MIFWLYLYGVFDTHYMFVDVFCSTYIATTTNLLYGSLCAAQVVILPSLRYNITMGISCVNNTCRFRCNVPWFTCILKFGTVHNIVMYATAMRQVILWDKVIESADQAHIVEEDVTIKYSFIDEVSSSMSGGLQYRLYLVSKEGMTSFCQTCHHCNCCILLYFIPQYVIVSANQAHIVQDVTITHRLIDKVS